MPNMLMAAVERREITLRHEVFAAIDRAFGGNADSERLIHILVQRSLVSLNTFDWMMNHLIRAIDDEGVRRIAMNILRDEYAETNHRYEFFMEIVGLGVTKKWLLNQQPSSATRRMMLRLTKMTLNLVLASDLERIAFLRFFGEILPGHEFAHLLAIMGDRHMINPRHSRFLRPHVDYDVMGNQAALPHSEQYKEHLEDALQTSDDLKAVDSVLRDASRIRAHFYAQFIGIDSEAPGPS